MNNANQFRRKVNLTTEARDFDLIYRKRAKAVRSVLVGGRRVERYFYKNPWRYDFSRSYAFGTVLQEFQNLARVTHKKIEVLEIGCGNGWFSLNANLDNHNSWDCVDISSGAIRVANRFKDKLKVVKNKYFIGGIESFTAEKKYDIIACVNTLHHLTDLRLFYKRTKELLKPNGRIFISDVSSDLFSEQNAFCVLLTRTILEVTRGIYYFEEARTNDMERTLEKIVYEWKNETDDGAQSVHDHFNSTPKIMSFLRAKFRCMYFRTHGGILMRLLGGLRGNSVAMQRLAKRLMNVEELMLRRKMIKPYTYTFVGKLKR